MRGEKSDESTSSVLKQRDVSVKWLRSWIGLKSSQSKVHEAGDVHTNADAPAKTEGGRVSEKGKDARSRPKFIGHCFWCGAHGHEKSDCRKKAAGRPRTARSPTISGRIGRDESSKGSERTLSFENWPDTDEEAMRRSIGSVSRHEKYIQQDWQAWEKIQEQAIRQWKPYKS